MKRHGYISWLCLALSLSTLSVACSAAPREKYSERVPGQPDTGDIDSRDGGVSWHSGTDGLDPQYAQNFGAWRGRPTTSNWINAHYLSWSWLTAPGLSATLDGTNTVRVWDMFTDWPGTVVLSMSMAGSDELTQVDYDEAMRSCANGEFDDEWNRFAVHAKSAGRTGANTVISLAHEFNGTWFRWNPGNVGVEVWIGCWRKIYTAIKQASDLRVAWVFSASAHATKGGDYAVASAWDAYPGDDYVDIIGINRYDFQMLSGRDELDWRSTCRNPQDLCYAADYARKHGKLLAVPEWSIERGKYGYGDNPSFIDLMYAFFSDNADILAFENNFNNGGNGEWHLFPEDSDNRESARRYQVLWGQQARP